MTNPVPAGYTAVTPFILSHDTGALIDFLMRASTPSNWAA